MSDARPSVETLREWLRASEGTARSHEACPDADRLWSAASGEADAVTTSAVVAHTVACGACSMSWRIAVDLIEVSGAGRARARGTPRITWGLASFAAAAVLVVAVGLGIVLRNGPSPDLYRLPAASADVRSLLEDGSAIPREAPLLRWSPVEPGAAYRVDVSTDSMRLLDRSPWTVATEYRLPEAALADVPSGGKIVWLVQVRLPDGRRLDSAAFINTVP